MRSSLADLMRRFLRRGPQRVVLIIASVVVLLVVAVAAAVVLGGSDDDDAAATPSPTTTTTEPSPTTTSSTTTTTTEPPTTTTTSRWTPQEQQVIDAYRSAWDIIYEASAPPEANPDDPRIPEHFTDIELDRRLGALDILQRRGGALVFPERSVHSLEVLSVNSGRRDGIRTARVNVCLLTDVEETVLATGATVPSYSGVRTVEVNALLHHVDGRWKVADNETTARQEGVAGCAAED